jgi:hypothetical protein
MTLKKPDPPFKKWQKFALLVFLGVPSFGEMYALKTDRAEFEKQHNTEFTTQMTKIGRAVRRPTITQKAGGGP